MNPLTEAEKTGYLRVGRRGYAYERWYARCRTVKRPFIAICGTSIRVDLINTDLRFNNEERDRMHNRWAAAICREPAHRNRHVGGGCGPVDCSWELCQHTIEPFAQEIIHLIFAKDAKGAVA